MRKLRTWRFLLMSIITCLCLFVIPFTSFSMENDKLKLIFGTDNLGPITWIIMSISLGYIGSGFLANGLKNTPGRAFGMINTLIGFSLIVVLSLYAFINMHNPTESKLASIIPTITFVSIDAVISIVHISINNRPATVTQVVQQVVGQAQVEANDGSINMNSVQLQDANELKVKIQNMQSGLTKSYDEAIDEIEKTGYLNGLEIGELSFVDDNPKIVPVEIAQDYSQPQPKQESQREYEEPKFYNSRRIEDDVLANYQPDDDYESINSTALSRRDDRNDGYKYLSRRLNDDKDAH
ncbi:hypothetical protein SCHIN_v1c03170 [Spiroplasma chinense]|uniref:Transmembrane protein n=1 Tax=Spiroplasma chinense TaxID=216932 RepID=A0A5B9Y3B6_9MOLU|nr:hypothetical protein [Spiroplasma chinense]QEH61514.1 hypothetical protein SCHIN_v1c03170 [Spiroplasma chinense]